jgi:hypothetical protein
MEPIRFDGPSIDYGVEKRLRRLNPRLKVTWSPYALDHTTGRPIEMSGALDCYTGKINQGVVKDPAYYLWIKDEAFNTYYLVGIYQKFGHEEVMHLEADVARHMDRDRVFEFLQERGKALRERGLARKRDLQAQKIRANKKRIHDLVFEGKDGVRDAKVSSYKGQTKRTSSGELNRIRKDAREDGWELPEGPQS